MPWTAPVYDEVRQVTQYPWPNCVLFEKTGDCDCYSQQATKITVDKTTCTNIVRNGVFDHSKDPPKEGRGDKQIFAGGTPPIADYHRSIIIKDSTPIRKLTTN
ncbi:MAG: hypothetical protein COA46_09865 [Porticoccaceae bacterium]|nr:MAG: hypothetical protein COA46_09865 [Porticoccaceae bacterium]